MFLVLHFIGPQTVSINGQHFIIQPAPVQPAQNDMESQDMKQSVNATLDGVEVCTINILLGGGGACAVTTKSTGMTNLI